MDEVRGPCHLAPTMRGRWWIGVEGADTAREVVGTLRAARTAAMGLAVGHPGVPVYVAQVRERVVVTMTPAWDWSDAEAVD